MALQERQIRASADQSQDQEGRHGEGDRRPRQGQDRPRAATSIARTARCWWKACSMVKRHTRPNPSKQIKGGIAERESSIAISNVMILTSGGVATRVGYRDGEGTGAVASGACAIARKGGEILGSKKGVASNMSRQMAERTTHITKNVIPALTKEFGYKNVMAVPKIEKIVAQYRHGRGDAERQADGRRGERADADRRPEAGDHQGQEIDRGVQAARRHADRLHGDAARRPHVRVSRPPGERRAAARARLSRRVDRNRSTAAATTRWA